MFDSIPATVFRDGTPQALTDEQEKLKREIYEKMNPRRRKFVDRIGYENWDPFQKPNDPLDLRMDVSKRTTSSWSMNFCAKRPEKGRTATTTARAPWSAPWAWSTRTKNTRAFSTSASGTMIF